MVFDEVTRGRGSLERISYAKEVTHAMIWLQRICSSAYVLDACVLDASVPASTPIY